MPAAAGADAFAGCGADVLGQDLVFSTLQTVYATGESRLSQQWMDAQPLVQAYYRLMLLEQDGKYQYSVPLRVQRTSHVQTQVLLYPNPTEAW